MAERVYVRDLEVLFNLQSELNKYSYGVNRVLNDVVYGISALEKYLEERHRYWNVELRRRVDVLSDCESEKDVNCSAEVAAVREAQEAIAHSLSPSTASEVVSRILCK